MGRKTRPVTNWGGSVGRSVAAKVAAVMESSDPVATELANEVQRLAGEQTPAAISALVYVMEDLAEKGMARVAAARVLLEYAHGRPGLRLAPRLPRIQVQILNLTNGQVLTPEDAETQEQAEVEGFLAQKAGP